MLLHLHACVLACTLLFSCFHGCVPTCWRDCGCCIPSYTTRASFVRCCWMKLIWQSPTSVPLLARSTRTIVCLRALQMIFMQKPVCYTNCTCTTLCVIVFFLMIGWRIGCEIGEQGSLHINVPEIHILGVHSQDFQGTKAKSSIKQHELNPIVACKIVGKFK